MPNYQNGKIYSIRSPNNEKYYIGSTTQQLCMRMAHHRKYKDTTASEIFNSGGAYIELLENYSCNNKEELCKREGELIREFKNNIVNKCIPLRTDKEYYEDNKDYINNRNKKYYEDNKDYINNRNKKYKEDNKEQIDIYQKNYRIQKYNCECGSLSINLQNKSRHEKSIKHINFIKI